MALPDIAVDATRRGRVARRSVLVTGVPRSGTTWLARELARADGAGLAGREPMNPRPGQFALGGTLSSWVELDELTDQQTRLLRRCYAGREPRVLSRYGSRQVRSVLPWTTTVVKDPFALLSVPAVVRVTDTVPVVVYRPAAAVLASYRRMGWRADTDEIRSLPGGPTGPAPADDVDAMAEFWLYLHERVLDWLPRVPEAVLVSHADMSSGGEQALARLSGLCGLGPRNARSRDAHRDAHGDGTRQARRAGLHDFQRSVEDVTTGWRSGLDPDEERRLDERTATVWQRLETLRVRVDEE